METVYEQPANLPSSPAGIINEEAEDMQDTSDENDDTDDNIDF